MNKRPRRRLDPDFRLEVAQLVVDQHYSIREAAEAMNVGKSSMDKWVRQLRQERQVKSDGPSPLTPDQRHIKDLERQLKRVEMEKEILEKATALLMSDELNDLR